MDFSQGKKEIVYWGRVLNQKGFVTGRSGNVSYKVDNKIFITAHNCYLGYLEEGEILLVDLQGRIVDGKGELTSEQALHFGIYNKFSDMKVVLHAHPPYTTAFFNYFNKLDEFSFETKFYLGSIPVLPQEAPTVVNVEPVLKALENNNIVVLKNHGVVAVGRDFKEAFSLIELLEEQAKVNLIIQGIGIGSLRSTVHSPQKEGEKISPQERGVTPITGEVEDSCKRRYKMLSEEHAQRLTELVNADSEAQELGKKYDLTCTLAVKNQDSGEVMCFYYDKGRIVNIDNNESAEFVIIGKEEILRKVFNRQIDPFVASTQGKVKTKGDFSKMSRWYPVMVRTFKLWEQAPVE